MQGNARYFSVRLTKQSRAEWSRVEQGGGCDGAEERRRAEEARPLKAHKGPGFDVKRPPFSLNIEDIVSKLLVFKITAWKLQSVIEP